MADPLSPEVLIPAIGTTLVAVIVGLWQFIRSLLKDKDDMHKENRDIVINNTIAFNALKQAVDNLAEAIRHGK